MEYNEDFLNKMAMKNRIISTEDRIEMVILLSMLGLVVLLVTGIMIVVL